MVQWVIGSILSLGGPIELFLIPTSTHGMCYPVCEMLHVKEHLLLIGKSSPYGGSRFPLSLSEWSITICSTPYNSAIFRSSQCSMTGVTKAMVCAILSVGWCI